MRNDLFQSGWRLFLMDGVGMKYSSKRKVSELSKQELGIVANAELQSHLP